MKTRKKNDKSWTGYLYVVKDLCYVFESRSEEKRNFCLLIHFSMDTMIGAGSGCSQSSVTPSWYPMWLAGAHILASSVAFLG